MSKNGLVNCHLLVYLLIYGQTDRQIERASPASDANDQVIAAERPRITAAD